MGADGGIGSGADGVVEWLIVMGLDQGIRLTPDMWYTAYF